jgi:TetR/AcrR family transcriptional repressor of nem operon
MKVSRARAEENRNRIVEVAGRLFREHGFDGIGIADLMKAAGLTHGGFYGNFKSKEDLAAQACAKALGQNRDGWARTAESGHAEPYGDLVRSYLSERHRDARGTGCVLAALAPDAARHGAEVRAAFTAGVRSYVEILSKLVPGRSKETKRKAATARLAEMVGALVLARAVDDPELSASILESALADLVPAR